ncbi:MAG: hypothetical protein ACJASV_001308 [Pseudorhodobacter sp.]|jgi:hypothetical protein
MLFMGSLKTYLAACLLGLLQAPNAHATDLVQLFADCAGRYSALTEHLWLWDGPASDPAALKRDQFAALLDAVLPAPNGIEARQALALRIEAKAAQRALLDRSAFRTAASGQDHAIVQAQLHLTRCESLLLSQ